MAQEVGDDVPGTLAEVIRQELDQNGSNKAIEFQGRTYDWAWVRKVADEVAGIVARTGIDPASPIAMVTTQDPALYAAFLGLMAAGRSTTMIYSFQSAEGIGRDIAKIGAGAIIAMERIWQPPAVAGAVEAGAVAIAVADDGSISMANGIERPAGALRVLPEPGIELLTSGTTGPPKRHLLSYASLKKTMVDVHYPLVPTPDGKALPHQLNFPFGNMAGVMNLLGAVGRKRWLWLEPKFAIDRWLAYIHAARLTTCQIPPPGVKMVLDAEVPVEELADVKYATVGAAAVDPHQRRLFEEKYGIKLLMSYGATEYAGAATMMFPEDLAKYGDAKFDSVGHAVYGAKIRIVDQETGEPLPPGMDNVGLVEVLQPAIDENWIHSNDLGCIDEDGFLYLLGRADGVINRGGFKIHPSTIEGAILQHPSVGAACVVGIPDDRLGTAPVAAVEQKPGAAPLDVADLAAFLRKMLPSTHIPVDYRVLDTLPRTPTLKFQIGAIRELFKAPAASA